MAIHTRKWIVEKDRQFGYWGAYGPKPGHTAWTGSFGFTSWRDAFEYAYKQSLKVTLLARGLDK